MLLGHIGVALIFSRIFNTNPLWTALGGILPDFDTIGFLLGYKWSSVHRKFTHSLIFLLVCGLLSLVFPVFISITIGVISHFLMDLDKWGIPLFYPFYKGEVSIVKMDHSCNHNAPFGFLYEWIRSKWAIIEISLFIIGILLIRKT